MNAEVISIGDELLIGQVVNTNASWMACELDSIGVTVSKISTIADAHPVITEAIDLALQNNDIVLLTGGLGPTKDDVTKKVLLEFFDDVLVSNAEVLRHIKNMFAQKGIPFSHLNEQQAELPSKCTVLHNDVGTAAGMWFNKDGKVLISMPGVPYEMKHLMKERVLPKLKDQFNLPYIIHNTIHTYGVPESQMAIQLEQFEEDLAPHFSLSYLPSMGRLRLRLSGRDFDLKALQEQHKTYEQEIKDIIGTAYVSSGDQPLNETVSTLMKDFGLTVALAESCTGGAIASSLTSLAGASQLVNGGVVAYNKDAKIKLLGVAAETIATHSVVSAEVASEMAKNAKNIFDTDYGIATTGNAGPTTDQTDESVGVVYIAIEGPSISMVSKFNFVQPRANVITRSVNKALELLFKDLKKNT